MGRMRPERELSRGLPGRGCLGYMLLVSSQSIAHRLSPGDRGVPNVEVIRIQEVSCLQMVGSGQERGSLEAAPSSHLANDAASGPGCGHPSSRTGQVTAAQLHNRWRPALLGLWLR